MSLLITFTDYASSTWMAKVEAEIYMRIYQYAAEDFRSVRDCNTGHRLVNTWMRTTNSSLQSFSGILQAHVHTGAFAGPTTPPVTPVLLVTTPPPPVPISTTLAVENQGSNLMIPSATLSYVDVSLSGINVAHVTFRRALEIPITYGPVSLAVKL